METLIPMDGRRGAHFIAKREMVNLPRGWWEALREQLAAKARAEFLVVEMVNKPQIGVQINWYPQEEA